MAVKPLEGNVLHIPGAAHPPQAVPLPGAHLLQQAPGGVGPLVVDVAADHIRQVFPFALHILLQQPASPGNGHTEKFPQQVRQLFQQLFPLGQEAVVDAAGCEAEELVFALLPHRGLQPGAVEKVQLPSDGGHIGAPDGAPAEDIHHQGVAAGCFFLQRSGDLGA